MEYIEQITIVTTRSFSMKSKEEKQQNGTKRGHFQFLRLIELLDQRSDQDLQPRKQVIKWNHCHDIENELKHGSDRWMALATGLRTVTSDRTVYNNLPLFIFSFDVVGMLSPDRNYRLVINLFFVLSGLYLDVLKTEKMLQFYKRLTLCAGNWFADRNERPNRIQ